MSAKWQFIFWLALFVVSSGAAGFIGAVKIPESYRRMQSAVTDNDLEVYSPGFRIQIRPEAVFTEYALPLKLFTVEIQQPNKLAQIRDLTLEFHFPHQVHSVEHLVYRPTGNISVFGNELKIVAPDRSTTFSREEPPLEHLKKHFSIAPEKMRKGDQTENGHIVYITGGSWPEGVLYIAKIVVDLSSELGSIIKMPDMLGKYEGHYKYIVKDSTFSGEMKGSIPAPGDLDIKISKEVASANADVGSLTITVSRAELFEDNGQIFTLLPQIQTEEISVRMWRDQQLALLAEISTRHLPKTVLRFATIGELKNTETHPRHEFRIAWNKNVCELSIDGKPVDVSKSEQ